MSRDRAVPVLLGLLLVLASSSVGLGVVGPATPGAFLAVAILVTAFFVSVVGPALGGGVRSLALFVAALPFLAFGALETPALVGTRPVPAAWFWGVVILGLVAPGLGRRRGGGLVAVVLTALAGAALLGEIPISPTAWAGGSPGRILAERVDGEQQAGVKRGAPLASDLAAVGLGPGPFLVEAARGQHPEDEPLYLVFGANGNLTGRQEGPGTFLPGRAVRGTVSAVELDVYDAAIVLPGAWPPGSGRLAEDLAIYARRGGVLVGPAPARAWPAPLGQELGAAGRAWTAGYEGARPFGLGLVVRAASEAGIREVLREAARRVPVRTAFDIRDAPAPPLPAALERWADRPASRRSQGILLLVYVVVAVLLDLVLRGGVPRIMGLVAPALAVTLGLVWTSPLDPGVRVHALAFDLGGGGGRRLDVVALASGPAGWVGPMGFQGAGFLRLVGAHTGPDGLVRVQPGRTGWVIRDSVAVGGAATEPEAREAGFLRELLRGDVEPARLRFGRSGPLDVRVGRAEVPRTWIVRWR